MAETVADTVIYQPPQKVLVSCAHCGTMVLRGIMKERVIVWQTPPLLPVSGDPHVCTSNS